MNNIKILILDDDDMIRENLKDFFEDDGFCVLTAKSGEEALEIMNREVPDVAIVDIRLPGIDGNTFILKSGLLRKNVKYIIHTGSSNYSLINELRNFGINDDQVFIKPLRDMNILENKVKELVNKNE